MPTIITAVKKEGASAKSAATNIWLQIFAALLILLASLMALELLFNLTGIGQQQFVEPDLQLGSRHINNQKVVWRLEGFSQDRISSSGLRDKDYAVTKAPGVKRIVVLGDSMAEGLQVPLAQTFAKRLESALGSKYEVINFACSGYSNGQEFLQFKKEVEKYQPDLAILLYNRNDSIENVRIGSSLKAEPRPYFYLDKTGNLQQDNAVLQDQSAVLKANPTWDFLRRNSRIFGVLSQTNLTLNINEPLYRKITAWLAKPFKKASSNQDQPPYAEQNVWLVIESLFAQFNQECRDHNCRFIVMTVPNTLNDVLFAKDISVLKNASQKDGFAFLDLTPIIKAHPDANSLFLKAHFSSAGHELVTKELLPLVKAELSN